MKFRDKGYRQERAARIADKAIKSYINRFWLKVGNEICIEVKKDWKRHYTETEKTGKIISKDNEHIVLLGCSGSPSRYILNTFDVMKIWF